MSTSRIRGKLLPFAVSIEVPILYPRAFSVLGFSRLAFASLAFASVVLAASLAGRSARAASPPPACSDEDLIAGKVPVQQRDMIGTPALVTDGNAVAEGAVWDGPAAIRLEGAAGSLTYDLGKPMQVSAFILQADANDTYKVSGSSDGQTFKLLVQAANLVDRGHGMRTRTMQIEPTTVRYIRVGEGEGDGAFSISEFAAYCRPPTPFPPALKTVEAPMAVGTEAGGGTAHGRDHRGAAGAARPARDHVAGRPPRPRGRERGSRPAAGARAGGRHRGGGAGARHVHRALLSDRPAAVPRQRLRRADVRDHLVPGAAAGARIVGSLDRGAAGDVHGRDVPRQHRPGALRRAQPAPAAHLRAARGPDRRLGPADAGGDAARARASTRRSRPTAWAA